jgi:hypothetical protein
MKPGRVIGDDEHDARTLAQQIVEDARAEAERLREVARDEIAKHRHDAEKLAGRIVQDARIEAERLLAPADGGGRARRGSAPPAGAVDEVIGLVLRAAVPGVALGEVVEIERRGGGDRLAAEVVGFRDLVMRGAYQTGQDPVVDDAVQAYPGIDRLVRQRRDDVADWDASLATLLTLAGPG